jgi:hypothetical protein
LNQKLLEYWHAFSGLIRFTKVKGHLAGGLFDL